MINTDTKYIANLEKLMPFYSFNRKNIELEGETVLEQMLNIIKSAGKICRIEILEECSIFGYIKEIEKDIVSINVLNDCGESDGESLIRVQDITCISFDSEEEVKREILSR